jgi:hypothetical protein
MRFTTLLPKALTGIFCLFPLVYTFLPALRIPWVAQSFLGFVIIHTMVGIWLWKYAATERGSWLAHPVALVICLLLPRFCIFPMFPWLSDDVYRYFWDGNLLVNGINPYLYTPASPALFTFRNELWNMVDYKNLTSIYPPLAQYCFGLSVMVAKLFTPSWFGALYTWKILLIVLEFIGIYWLYKVFRLRNIPLYHLYGYLVLPLPILEIAGQGHLDGLLLTPLGICLYFVVRAEQEPEPHFSFALLSGLCIGLLAGIKLYPFVLFFVGWFVFKNRRLKMYYTVGCGLSLIILFAPLFYQAAALRLWFESLQFVSRAFQFNGVPYYGFCMIFGALQIPGYWMFTPIIFTWWRMIIIVVSVNDTEKSQCPSGSDVHRVIINNHSFFAQSTHLVLYSAFIPQRNTTMALVKCCGYGKHGFLLVLRCGAICRMVLA